ncbi:uncharacterized protein LOC133843378 isoform X2 [Drosophila sulfurigaster albostrigata]|uniref:uncharacterized protein LOC133843378 isoform X2 n=1 Tax=Drosophila sulfurigaster albostrigata TaxID=89887 RepID=UPI002D21DD4C|nr:uncharacterized protein LOC133843378 isoform X2 [Drosophila sulfurigaster albostrigata]
MGVTDFIESVKRWTVNQLDRKSKQEEELKPVRQIPNLGEDIQMVVQTPEFENVMNSVSPFLLASLGAWPGYWLYRGFDYHSHRAYVPLPVYIRQTFYQAKMLQFFIIMAGIIYMAKHQTGEHVFPVNHKIDD